jgi:DNA polymerase/3'-5' exonuclease PolX
MQKAPNYEQRLRDRDFQLAQTRLRVDEVENAIANLAVVRSPYAGRIRRIKWLGQDSSGLLSAEITLMVRSSAGVELTVPE